MGGQPGDGADGKYSAAPGWILLRYLLSLAIALVNRIIFIG